MGGEGDNDPGSGGLHRPQAHAKRRFHNRGTALAGGNGMRVHELVNDELWAAIAPLLPPRAPHPKGGRPWADDRAALCGILYVLRTGIQWRMLPAELGCSSGVTCWRRLRDWARAGVWRRLWA